MNTTKKRMRKWKMSTNACARVRVTIPMRGWKCMCLRHRNVRSSTFIPLSAEYD
jgi:hypothetical protein